MLFFALQIFLDYGVDPDMLNGKDIHVLTELLTAANRWLTHSVAAAQDQASVTVTLTSSLMKLFLNFLFLFQFKLIRVFPL